MEPASVQTVSSWKHDPWALRALFRADELRRLERARREVDPQRRTIVCCVWENAFAKSGGLFAVARSLPPALQQRNPAVVVLSPLHSRLKTAPVRWRPGESAGSAAAAEAAAPPAQAALRLAEPVSATTITFDGRDRPIWLWEHRLEGVRWILFESPGFFEAAGGPQGINPYDYTGPDAPDAPSGLTRDSLFACAAVPHILAALGITSHLVFHPHDWQFVATVLTVKQALLEGVLQSAAVVLTSHNPYDSELTDETLRLVTLRTAATCWPTLRADPDLDQRDSFYERMLPLLDGPITTVSRAFAVELTEDPLQTFHFANHLQEIFARQRVIGVNNGLFLAPTCPFPEKVVRQAQQGQAGPILQHKRQLRQQMLDLWTDHPPPGVLGTQPAGHGPPLRNLPDTVPVFMMFGRMDPCQKGFDVMARAIELLPPGAARFILTPDVGGGVEAFTEDLRRLVRSRPGEVLCVLGRMERGYLETMAGATYCVLPSLYEPFGGATEPYLKGTPVVARATGGLVQQVIDLRQDRSEATGLLYREQFVSDSARTTGLLWRELLECVDPRERCENPLYAALVESLAQALIRAIEVYQHDPEGYALMLSNLHRQALRFSWEQAADEYGVVYDLATE